MNTGPVVIGFDGTPAAERAIRQAAQLLSARPALVVVVWEAEQAFELATLPVMGMELPATRMDIRVAAEADHARYETAQEAARHGAAIAREAGLQAESMVVADEVTVAETLVRVARDCDAPAIVVGAHRRGALAGLLLGSTSRDVLKHSDRPVVVVRESEQGAGDDSGG